MAIHASWVFVLHRSSSCAFSLSNYYNGVASAWVKHEEIIYTANLAQWGLPGRESDFPAPLTHCRNDSGVSQIAASLLAKSLGVYAKPSSCSEINVSWSECCPLNVVHLFAEKEASCFLLGVVLGLYCQIFWCMENLQETSGKLSNLGF